MLGTSLNNSVLVLNTLTSLGEITPVCMDPYVILSRRQTLSTYQPLRLVNVSSPEDMSGRIGNVQFLLYNPRTHCQYVPSTTFGIKS